jgi:predicted MFS family arabinose efflux permease
MIFVPKHQIVYSGVALIAVTYGFARYNYGLFLPFIRDTFRLQTPALGLIASGSYAGYLISTLISSLITERTGPRFSSIVGGMCACTGLTIVAFAGGPWLLALGVIIAGCSAGWAYPAMPEAITQVIPKEHHSRSLSWINAGTSFGVLLSGPFALFLSFKWRIAWYGFALISLFVTIWNWIVLPGKKKIVRKRPIKLNIHWLFCSQSRPLFITAFCVGFTTSIFWTFSVDLLVQENNLSRYIGQTFWIIVGGAGVFGIAAGYLIEYVKFKSVFMLTLTMLSSALILLALKPSSFTLVCCSAIFFGCSYFIITGLLAIWSVNVFRTRPSTGLGSIFLALSMGQIIGPTIFGRIAGTTGMRPLFIIVAGFVFFLFPVIPGNKFNLE